MSPATKEKATGASHAPKITLHECPRCAGSERIIKVQLPAVGQTALIPLCECRSPELKLDGDAATHTPTPELVQAVRDLLGTSPSEFGSALEILIDRWGDMLLAEPLSPAQQAMHRAAVQYLDRGYEIVPLHGAEDGRCTCRKAGKCKSRGKHPIRTGWQDRPVRSRTELASLFRSRAGRPTNLGQMLRIAAELHLMEQAEIGSDRPWETDVHADTIERAIAIAEYFRAHMARLFVEPPQVLERIALDWIRENGEPEFSPRDLFRSKHRKFENMEEVHETLRSLEQMGWIRSQVRPTQGRPATRYIVFAEHSRTPRLWVARPSPSFLTSCHQSPFESPIPS